MLPLENDSYGRRPASGVKYPGIGFSIVVLPSLLEQTTHGALVVGVVGVGVVGVDVVVFFLSTFLRRLQLVSNS